MTKNFAQMWYLYTEKQIKIGQLITFKKYQQKF